MTNITKRLNGKALIFSIERSSMKDGPGIRTVVFFKGCNMRCYWCHNPESINSEIDLKFDETKCIGCMECVQVCNTDAHSFNENHHVINPEKCLGCCACADVCYTGALERVGKLMDVDEVFEEIAEDRSFYSRSGGGVTLSGGEVMLHGAFVGRLLKRCKQDNIHTAIDTNMSLPWKEYKKVLPDIDLVMADIKHMDDAAHRQGTGASNQRVLSNIQKLAVLDKPMIIRTPIIPGFNNTQENVRNTALFIQSFKSLLYYELLSYNPLGNSKGVIVGGNLETKDIVVPKREEMVLLAGIAAKTNIRVLLDGREYLG